MNVSPDRQRTRRGLLAQHTFIAVFYAAILAGMAMVGELTGLVLLVFAAGIGVSLVNAGTYRVVPAEPDIWIEERGRRE